MKKRLSTLLLLICAVYAAPAGSQGTIKRAGKPDVVSVADTDAAMNRAIWTARQTVGRFILALKAPRRGQVDFAVKKPFATKNGREHIWVSELTFDGKNFKGRVANEPLSVKNIKIGDVVSVGKTEISDWNYTDKGHLVGGYTVRVLYNRMSAAEKREFRAQTGLIF